jgi:hypothetical protein
MSASKVLASSFIKLVVNAGRMIHVKYATKTLDWKQSYLSPDVQNKFMEAVGKANVPTGATVAVLT